VNVRRSLGAGLCIRFLFGVLLVGSLPGIALGWNYSLFSEFNEQMTDTSTRNKLSGETTDSSSSVFSQRYNLNLSHSFFPSLMFQGGATWEDTNVRVESDDSSNTSSFSTLRPFAGLRLSNPLYNFGANYSEIMGSSELGSGQNIETRRKEFDIGGGFNPVGLPSLGLRYGRVHSFDDPLTRDTLENDYRLNTSYDYRDFGMTYSYSRGDVENLLSGSTQSIQSHTGRIDYSRRFFEGRTAVTGTYGINYSTTEFRGPQPDPVPLGRSAGLFAVDDTPEDEALDLLNALIDSDTETSTGVNLGVNGGDQTVFFNIGLDLGFAIPVERLYVWVDKPVEGAAVNGFTWRVYVSDRNDESAVWKLIEGPGPASFSSFFNRFEIPIPRTEARYFKVVVQPLSAANPSASRFQDLFVTEMEALTLPPAGTNRTDSLSQDLGIGIRHQVNEKTSVSYNGVYRRNESLLADRSNFQLSNSFHVSHIFSRRVRGSAALGRTDQWGGTQDASSSTDFSTSLKGNWSPVFSQSINFSASQASGTFESSRYSMLLRNQFRPYRGWTLNIDSGESWRSSGSSTLVRIRTSVRPHPKVSFGLGYSGTFAQGGGNSSSNSSSQQYDAQAFYSPVPTLSLSAGLQSLDRNGENRTSQNYAVNWAPWSGGDLQFSIAYSESLSPTSDAESRQLSPRMTWRISQHFTLSTAYSIVRGSTQTQETDSQTLRGTLTMVF